MRRLLPAPQRVGFSTPQYAESASERGHRGPIRRFGAPTPRYARPIHFREEPFSRSTGTGMGGAVWVPRLASPSPTRTAGGCAPAASRCADPATSPACDAAGSLAASPAGARYLRTPPRMRRGPGNPILAKRPGIALCYTHPAGPVMRLFRGKPCSPIQNARIEEPPLPRERGLTPRIVEYRVLRYYDVPAPRHGPHRYGVDPGSVLPQHVRHVGAHLERIFGRPPHAGVVPVGRA